MDLLKQGVEIIHRGSFKIFCSEEEEFTNTYSSRPFLAKAVADWFLGKYLKLNRNPEAVEKLVHDLVPARIGVTLLENLSPAAPSEEQCDPAITCFPVSWAEHLMMRGVARTNADIPESEWFLTLAVTCLVRTADGMYLLAKRSRDVSTHKGLWSVTCAGYVDWERLLKGDILNPVFAELVFAELVEESALTRDRLTVQPKLLGLCRHPLTPKLPTWIEASFFAKTDLTAPQALELAKNAKDTFEGKHEAFTEAEVRALMEEAGRVHPPAAANIALALGLV